MAKLNYGPDFICIGAQKSGTSWLFRNLNFHPETVMSEVKEINYFFPEDYDKAALIQKWLSYKALTTKGPYASKPGETRSHLRWWIDRFFWFRRYIFAGRDVKNYYKLFPKLNNKITGDISPSYALMPEEKIKAIASIYPKVKIIYLLRNPIDRAWSQFRMRYFDLLQQADSEEKIIADLKLHSQVYDFGFYVDVIKRWEHYFPHMRVWFYDQLCEAPRQLFDEICDYVGIANAAAKLHWPPENKVFVGPQFEMPQTVGQFLGQVYKNEIAALHAKFANQYTKRWMASPFLRCAEEAAHALVT